MKIRKLKRKLICIALLPISFAIRDYFSNNNHITESFYSRLIYPPIGRSLSKLTGFFSFSAAEILFYASISIILYLTFKVILRLIKSADKLQETVSITINALCVLSITYFLFLFLWGFNYYRQPLAYSLNYNIKESTVSDLKALCSDLIDKTNSKRAEVSENSSGVMYIEGGVFDVISRASKGYENIALNYPILSGIYGKPKAAAASRALSYAGIAGIYFPFTAEANVNKLVPAPLLPSTICHEMAHQRGFAREDEANFIAYLVCKAHPDNDFQYSGYLLALIHSMNALYNYDAEAYKELTAAYSPGLVNDLKYNSDFWKQFEGPAEDIQERINDAYLKSNKQKDGIHSYGRMVDLLLAEYKTNLLK